MKKSAEGQVWLVSLERFVLGFEAHYGVKVPAQVKEGLRLFIGPLEQSEMRGLLAGDDPEGPFSRKHGVHQELHQQRFVAKTLMRVAPDVWESTIAWLRMELPRITEMCFARGLCAEEKGRAEFVWYNVVDEESGRLSARRVIRIDELVRAIEALPMEKRASPGRKNGGSVITMPFGSLQMHSPNDDNQLQFRHRLLSVTALLPVR